MPKSRPVRSRRIKARTMEGHSVTLRMNEPVPVPVPEPRLSRLIDTKKLGTAGLRIEIERILDPSCGPDRADRLLALGPQAAPVLVKIATASPDCLGCTHRRPGAISGLGLFATLEASDALSGILENDAEDDAVRATAAVALGRIGSAGAVARLSATLERASSSALRMAAAKGLAWSGSVAAAPPLQRAATEDPDSSVRGQADAALKAIAAATGLQLGAAAGAPIPKLRRPKARRAPGPVQVDSGRGGRVR